LAGASPFGGRVPRHPVARLDDVLLVTAGGYVFGDELDSKALDPLVEVELARGEDLADEALLGGEGERHLAARGIQEAEAAHLAGVVAGRAAAARLAERELQGSDHRVGAGPVEGVEDDQAQRLARRAARPVAAGEGVEG